MDSFDNDTFRSARDIWDRLSRLQQQSKWIPKRGDWCCANGVVKQIDCKDPPRELTNSDEVDYDCLVPQSLEVAGSFASSGYGHVDDDDDDDETIEEDLKSPGNVNIHDNVFEQMDFSRQLNGTDAAALTPLHLASASVAVTDRTTKNHSRSSQTLFTMDDGITIEKPKAPEMPPVRRFVNRSDILDTVSQTTPLSNEGQSTQPRVFSMRVVRATLRDPDERPGELVKNYNWYPDAVPIDGLFPPGVPLSAKEICAYYPHHVRWQDVMLRLAQNDYRGPDILGIEQVPTDSLSR